jgi:hypothetical protein
MLKNTGVLGLGSIPNRHKKKKSKQKTKQPSDPTLVKHKKDPRKKEEEEAKSDPNTWRGA